VDLQVPATAETRLVPVLSLDEMSLFPGGSLSVLLDGPGALAAVALAARSGGMLLAVTRREEGGPRNVYRIGTLASVGEGAAAAALGGRIELEGQCRARIEHLVGSVDLLVAEVSTVPEGDPGEEWGPAVEALARYLHGHPDLRSFLDRQHRSGEPTRWVALACQHLPITASARQKLLEAGARERCAKISRGLTALLRKEHSL